MNILLHVLLFQFLLLSDLLHRRSFRDLKVFFKVSSRCSDDSAKLSQRYPGIPRDSSSVQQVPFIVGTLESTS